MSATLTWNVSGLYTKSGTTVGAFWTDLRNMIQAKAADANYKWEVASSNVGSTPYYVVLKRKDASVGRILFVQWTSPPAGNNSAILATAPTTSYVYAAYFPSGNVDTPSNLTASSGTIMGSDTNCTKVAAMIDATTCYSGTQQMAYFDSDGGVVVVSGSITGYTTYMIGAGELVVDNVDTAYPCAFGSANLTLSALYTSSGSACFGYAANKTSAGSSSVSYVRINDGGTDLQLGIPYAQYGGWMSATLGVATDILSNNTNNKAWFIPVSLIASEQKGLGFKFKFRQLAMGPTCASGPFNTYSTTGPVVQTIALNTGTAATSQPTMWAVNFKV